MITAEDRGHYEIMEVIATNTDFYSLSGKIQTGPYTGKTGLFHRSIKTDIGDELLVRLELPREHLSKLKLTGKVTGDVVTNAVPFDINHTAPNQIIFLTQLDKIFTQKYLIPKISGFSDYYFDMIIPDAIYSAPFEGQDALYVLSRVGPIWEPWGLLNSSDVNRATQKLRAKKRSKHNPLVFISHPEVSIDSLKHTLSNIEEVITPKPELVKLGLIHLPSK
jgi:hypothetical protein